jgi:hypothetical protein
MALFRLAIASVFLQASLIKMAGWEVTIQIFAASVRALAAP